jgi:hypothetical protein
MPESYKTRWEFGKSHCGRNYEIRKFAAGAPFYYYMTMQSLIWAKRIHIVLTLEHQTNIVSIVVFSLLITHTLYQVA